jgi:hypothetical protein
VCAWLHILYPKVRGEFELSFVFEFSTLEVTEWVKFALVSRRFKL